jgi:hypothetical protein
MKVPKRCNASRCLAGIDEVDLATIRIGGDEFVMLPFNVSSERQVACLPPRHCRGSLD